MAVPSVIRFLDRQKWLEPVGSVLQKVAESAFTDGPNRQKFKNFLHGTWQGHPLHPALTDVPVGAWTAAAALDTADAISPHQELAAGADAAVTIGLLGAVGAAVTGLNDWQHTDDEARHIGVAHGLLNVGALLLYSTSLALRLRGARSAGKGIGFLAYAVAGTSAYLGGHLVYGKRIGVDHSAVYTPPGDFVPVLAAADLPERELRRVEAAGMPVLLFREGDRIHALCETCTHLGGPLSEGELKDESVICPWHGSRFALADTGRVLDGPATFPEPCFETRVINGQIEVRSVKD